MDDLFETGGVGDNKRGRACFGLTTLKFGAVPARENFVRSDKSGPP